MAYTELRKFLVSDGYIKLQPDVFMRVEDRKKSCPKHQNRIKMYLPPTGEVKNADFDRTPVFRLYFVPGKARLTGKVCRGKGHSNTINVMSPNTTFRFRKVIQPPSPQNSNYGYLWWLGEGWYGCRGYGGQAVTVFPEQNKIVVTQATATSRPLAYEDIWFGDL